MICVSIAEPTAEACIRALSGAEFAEIRLEGMKLSDADVKKIFSQKAKLIATCRPGALPEEARKKMLLGAICAGAAYVDVEVDASDAYKQEVIGKAREKGCKVIVSFHDYARTPQRAELEQIANWCFESGADIAKIACMAKSEKDAARLLGLLDTDRKIAVVSMGKKGKIARIVAPILGSQIAYVSAQAGKETADGQISKKDMERLLKVLEDA
jgi:3-dehydroquinate dehydratase I